MEAFSLLKFWRGGGSAAAGSAAASAARSTDSSAATTTILTAVAPHFSDSDSETASDSDGPFFDLEFTAVPDEEDGESKSGGNDGGGGDQINGHQHAGEDEGSEADDSDNEEEEEEDELNLTFSTSSASSVDRTDPDVSLSPSDDLFFKGRLVPVESSSLLLNETEANSKFPVSLVKTATKFRVLMLKLKKPKANAEQKPEKSEPDGVNPAKPSPKGKPENEKDESQSRPEKKFFTVRFKVEEVNIKSLFTRDNSSKNANNGKATQKTNAEDSHSSNVDSNSSSSSLAEEKKFSKEMMQKYLKMVKPLYIRVSKRYGEKLRFSGQLSLAGEKGEAEAAEVAEKTAVLSNVKSLKQGNLPAGLRVVRKHLRKSRSAPSPVVSSSGELSSRRRDDSLLQQQDGIQSAILHCKRSFNSTRDSNLSILSRTTSDASHEKPINLLAVADDSSSPKEVKPQSGKLSI
nr:probable membrane-associated kinase regulator 2 [Ipomoea batatas]GME14623.1 probable membrane-associated kinase regulator 2 [Ipomoea batatas]